MSTEVNADFMSFQPRYQDGFMIDLHIWQKIKDSKLHIIILGRSVIVHLHFTRTFWSLTSIPKKSV